MDYYTRQRQRRRDDQLKKWCFDDSTDDQAIQGCDAVIKLNPNDALAFNNRGFAYKHKGQYDRAIQDYDQAIKLNPNAAAAIDNRANAIAKKNK